MNLNPPVNPNYCATVVALSSFVDLPNCDNVKAAIIFGNSIIVAKNAEKGAVGLFFPVETALSKEFLSNNNLYRKPEYGNLDKDKTGFFEQHGRVKAMKFRGHKSEGFWIPLESLAFTGSWDIPVGTSFDTVPTLMGEIEICHKYIPKGKRVGPSTQPKSKTARLEDSIVDGQFRFHFDTENLRRNAHKINPSDWISITDKWHGTSVVIGKVLTKRPLNLFERLLSRLGVKIEQNQYGMVYSSRRVIKAVNGVTKNPLHYYTEDIWGVVAEENESKILNGFTLYGEIVGYTSDGSPIQGGYAYGCSVNTHKFLVYRVTFTNFDGKVFELPYLQMKEFAQKYGFETLPELFYGRADQFEQYSADEELSVWQERFLKKAEQTFVRDQDCPYNPKGTPAEGVVVRIDRLQECENYKLKNFRFLERESKELDSNTIDIETAESVPEEAVS